MIIIHYKIEQHMECFSETKTKTEIKFVHLYIFFMELKKKKNTMTHTYHSLLAVALKFLCSSGLMS